MASLDKDCVLGLAIVQFGGALLGPLTKMNTERRAMCVGLVSVVFACKLDISCFRNAHMCALVVGHVV